MPTSTLLAKSPGGFRSRTPRDGIHEYSGLALPQPVQDQVNDSGQETVCDDHHQAKVHCEPSCSYRNVQAVAIAVRVFTVVIQQSICQVILSLRLGPSS